MVTDLGQGKPSLESPWAQIQIELRGDTSGTILDAGTGEQSTRWLLEQECASWTGVTACPRVLELLQDGFGKKLRRQDRFVLGNWSDPHLLSGEVYDTVIAHYLLGAVERFEPYQQQLLFRRLRRLVGGKMYVIGLQPLSVPSTSDEVLVKQLLDYRDSGLVFSGGRPYREYPFSWVQNNLEDSGFRILSTRCFSNHIGEPFVERLMSSTFERVRLFDDSNFGSSFRDYGERLWLSAKNRLASGPLPCSFDYLVTVE